tara:strand:- start:484 stop:735 length:252 start_codon:yes stop_codon:yes gene_type:complete
MNLLEKNKMKKVKEMIKDATPLNSDDCGSERQVVAENLLFNTLSAIDASVFGEGSPLYEYCLNATVDEMKRLRHSKIMKWVDD